MGLFDGIKKAVGLSKEDGSSATATSTAPTAPKPSKPLNTERVLDDSQNRGLLEQYNERVKAINALEDEYEKLDDAALRSKSEELRRAVSGRQRQEDEVLEEAFALVREAAYRSIGLRHYDVQLVGGMALWQGRVAEMATGEGKTLVATLAVYLKALTGRGVHVVTVNDYLARRDAQQMGQVYRFLGLSVGLVQAGDSYEQRRDAYDCSVTYVTNSELGFDYLRDNLAVSKEEVVLRRPFHFCVVDEADSILIDEARTPLIISGKTDAPRQKYQGANKLALMLEKDVHYTVSEKQQSVLLTEKGQSDAEEALGGRNLYDARDPWINFITNAVKAKELFKKDVHYLVRGNEIVIVDEFTGRAMEGRRWGQGLHQAVEAKEGITVDTEAQTIASVSYQSFFNLYPVLSGMTGTAATEADEFASTYGLSVVRIPTALPTGRRDYPDAVYKNKAGKLRNVMREIAEQHPKGRPILVGTTSVEDSEALSALLREVEVPHEVLNARPENVRRENEIIAQAGRVFALTIATNMAGRGTDILLGGSPEYEMRSLATRRLAQAMGHKVDDSAAVAATERIVPVELSDELSGHLDEIVQKVAKQKKKKCGDVQAVVVRALESRAQAGSSDDDEEEENDGDGEVLDEFADVLGQMREELKATLGNERERVIAAGGLLVLGTNRHESRRIDNQLRGRAGRQGDPGATRFYLSLEDDIFRVFGGANLQKLLDAFRVDENTPIENRQVTDALDRSQKNVEEYYYDIRKTLSEYDEVLATQRESFYSKRRRMLMEDDEEVLAMMEGYCLDTLRAISDAFVGRSGGVTDCEKLSAKVQQFFAGVEDVDAARLAKLGGGGELVEHLQSAVTQRLRQKESELEDVKPRFAAGIERYIVLTQMDNLWKQHLRDMEYLQQVVSVRSFGNMKPLDEYQNEGYSLFTAMNEALARNSAFSLFQYQPDKNAARKDGGGGGGGGESGGGDTAKKAKRRARRHRK